MKKPAASKSPTILAINTSERSRLSVAWVENGKVTHIERDEPAQSVSKTINDFLAANNQQLTNLDAVAVVNLAYSLTGTRIGVTVANTLGWLLDIPALEITAEVFEEGLAKLSIPRRARKAAKVANEIVY